MLRDSRCARWWEEKSCELLLMSIRVMLLALTLYVHFRRLMGFPFLHLSRRTPTMLCISSARALLYDARRWGEKSFVLVIFATGASKVHEAPRQISCGYLREWNELSPLAVPRAKFLRLFERMEWIKATGCPEKQISCGDLREWNESSPPAVPRSKILAVIWENGMNQAHRLSREAGIVSLGNLLWDGGDRDRWGYSSQSLQDKHTILMRFDCANVNLFRIIMSQIWHFLSMETKNVTKLTNECDIKSIGFQ